MTAQPAHLDELLTRHPTVTHRVVSWSVMALMTAFIGWAAVAQLDEVATAPAEVMPQGRVKVIQHLEGGLITDVYIQEGDVVRLGTPLMQLDLAVGGLNREELRIRLDGLLLVHARLTAQAEGNDLAFPPALAERRPRLSRSETDIFDARQREHASTLAGMREQVAQRDSELRELEAKERATIRNLAVSREKLKMSASLLSEGLTARMDHLQLQSEVQQLDGLLDTLRQGIPRVRSALAESRERMTEEGLRFQREAREQLGETEVAIARTRELLSQATDQQARTVIRSPIEGVVKNMRYNTVGGVVKAGEAILDIVPTRDNLVVEARLSAVDRGYVREGQDAMVKISTYDYARYGGLSGKVIQVAPDATTPERGEPYFRVIVQPERSWLGISDGDLPITPGMQATVDVHTGTRSVLDYLITPVLKLRQEAFRER